MTTSSDDNPPPGESVTDNTKIASPEATGGAGSTFESRVAAIVLSRLLRADRIVGLGLPITRVRLQQRVQGLLLDDIVVEGIDPLGATRIIEFQSKRQISPASSDGEYVETIGRCLDTLAGDTNDDIPAGRHRFGIVSKPSQALADLDRLTEIARAHDNPASFVAVARKATRASVGQKLNQLRDTIIAYLTAEKDPPNPVSVPAPPDAEVDELSWRVAKALYVWTLDGAAQGAAVLAAEDRIADLAPLTDPADVFQKIEQRAKTWAASAASISLSMLRGALEEDGVALDAAPAQAVAYEALRSASAPTLDLQVARLGGQLQLPRHQLRADIIDSVRQHQATLLSGRAGVGKSILGRLVADDLRAEGATVLGLSLTGRAGSLSALEADLAVDLRAGFAGAPTGALRVLVIDGAEQALTDSGALLAAVLDTVAATTAGGTAWQVLVTARDEAATPLINLIGARIPDPVRLNVTELTDDEVTQVVDHFPVLRPLQRNPRAAALLLRRPYLVELLVRATVALGLPPNLVGEEDLLDMVTARLIRRDEGGLPGVGAPDARSDIYLALAVDVLAGTMPASLDGRDTTARQGLLSDDVIARVRLSWRFAHDVLTDYAVATRLLEPGGSELLLSAPQPRRLLRAVRLRMQRSLADSVADESVAPVWPSINDDAAQLATADGPRWLDIPYQALLHLGLSREALQALAGSLLDNGGAELARLVDVAQRLGRLNVADVASGPARLDPTLTGPVVDLLAALGSRIPETLTFAAARLVHDHLAAVYAHGAALEVSLLEAATLPDVLLGWAGDHTYGELLELCIGSLGFLGPHLQPHHEAFLVRHSQNRPEHVAELVESPGSSRALAASRPEVQLRLASLYYLGRTIAENDAPPETGKRPRSRGSPFAFDDPELAEDGVRDHAPRQTSHLAMVPLGNNQSNPELGPFLALLNADPDRGLKLVGAVVDAATAARARVEAGFEHSFEMNPGQLNLTLQPGGDEQGKTFTGPATVWRWHRRTGVGPGPALSALMALREWASSQIAVGVDVTTVRDQILDAGSSLAFPSVAWFVMLEHLDEVNDEMDIFLVHPVVWTLENERHVHEPEMVAFAVPEMTRLTWTVSNVAMQLVLRGDEQRRAVLAAMGEELKANADELDRDGLVVRRWANELNIDQYRVEPVPEGAAVTVDHGPDLVAQLGEGMADVLKGLDGATLMRRAADMRDGHIDPAEAEHLWGEVIAHLTKPGNNIYDPADLVAAAAAGVVRAATSGVVLDDSTIRDAVAILLQGAQHVGALAPPALDTFAPDTNPQNSRFVRDMFWDDGMDRSVASALPALLADPTLTNRAGITLEDIAAGVVEVAAGPYLQARARLASALSPLCASPCNDDTVHQTILAAANRMIETVGYGPDNHSGHGYPPATLPAPVGDFLASSSGLVLELTAAADAVALLVAAAEADCVHGQQAAELLNALIAYDERVWVSHYADRHYIGMNRWRHQIDRALARKILRGDIECLRRRIEAFAGAHEQLTELLTALVAEATDPESAAALHQVWPIVLDRLLPESRDLTTGLNRRDRPSRSSVEELDKALLLVPGEHAADWPWKDTVALGVRWFDAFADRPDLADQAITFMARLFGLKGEAVIRRVLQVLGEDPKSITREARQAVSFLELVLQDPPSAGVATQARQLLDRLAANGDERALTAQQAIENLE